MVTTTFSANHSLQPPLRPTEGELEILSVIWEQGEASVRDIHQALLAYKQTGYTTSLKLLQLMFEKGMVKRTERGRKHYYRSALDKAALEERLVEKLAEQLFEGSPAKLAARALSSKRYQSSRSDLQDLQQVIETVLNRTA